MRDFRDLKILNLITIQIAQAQISKDFEIGNVHVQYTIIALLTPSIFIQCQQSQSLHD